MSQSVHNMKLTATDKTSGAFASIAGRASKLGGLMSSAFAGLGAYVGLRTIASGLQELGHLSDIAMKANMSVSDLTATTQAFGVLGIQNMGVDQFAKALDYMQKTTGRRGMQGFRETMAEIADVPDVAKRGQLAMKYFGRMGMELMPIIATGKEGMAVLNAASGALVDISDRAANGGDSVADAMDVATMGIKNSFLGVLGEIGAQWDGMFGANGGIVATTMAGMAVVSYYIMRSFYALQNVFQNLAYYVFGTFDSISAFFSHFDMSSPVASIKDAAAAFGTAWKNNDAALANMDAEREAKIKELEAARDKRLENAREYGRLGGGLKMPGAVGSGADADKETKAEKAAKATNALTMANSNAARKLAILGPSFQSESKKQTEVQQKILENQQKQMEADRVDSDNNKQQVIGVLEV